MWGLPLWLSQQLTSDRQETLIATLMGVVLVPLVIPWGYVFKHYVKAPGNPWGRRATASTQAPVADDTGRMEALRRVHRFRAAADQLGGAAHRNVDYRRRVVQWHAPDMTRHSCRRHAAELRADRRRGADLIGPRAAQGAHPA